MTADLPSRAEDFPECPLLVYPTRGIRRKNLGEAVLWACLLQQGAQIVTTRGPANPLWRGIHDEWERFAGKLGLPITFAVVDRRSPKDIAGRESTEKSFRAWLGAPDAILTTSVAEGFGLAFLEPTMLGLPLLGRDLPDITGGFEINLRGLYRAIRFPSEWINGDGLRRHLAEHLTNYYRKYGRDLPSGAVEAALSGMVDSQGRLDFGRLDEAMQRDVISCLVACPEQRSHVVVDVGGEAQVAIAWLNSLFRDSLWQREAESNRAVLEARFSLRAYANRLWSYYKELHASEGDERVSPNEVAETLLNSFLDPRHFSFLRS